MDAKISKSANFDTRSGKGKDHLMPATIADTHIGDVALFRHKVSHIKGAVAREDEFLETSACERIDETVLREEGLEELERGCEWWRCVNVRLYDRNDYRNRIKREE